MITFSKLADAVVFLVYEYAIADTQEQTSKAGREPSRAPRDYLYSRFGEHVGSRQIEAAIKLAQERKLLEEGMRSYIGLTLTGRGIECVEANPEAFRNAMLDVMQSGDAASEVTSTAGIDDDSQWNGPDALGEIEQSKAEPIRRLLRDCLAELDDVTLSQQDRADATHKFRSAQEMMEAPHPYLGVVRSILQPFVKSFMGGLAKKILDLLPGP